MMMNKNMKYKRRMALVAILLLMGLLAAAGCSANKAGTANNNPAAGSPKTSETGSPQAASVQPQGQQQDQSGSAAQQVSGKDTDGDGIPDDVEKTYGTNPYAGDTDGDGQNDKDDNQPLLAQDPIKESSTTKLPVKIKDARVEDNATADHLEITLANSGAKPLKGFEIYYTITDDKTGEKEAYYRKLDLELQAGESRTIHFDNQQKADHYPGNMNGLYGTSANGLTFNLTLHVPGYEPLTFQVKKAKGTAEVAD